MKADVPWIGAGAKRINITVEKTLYWDLLVSNGRYRIRTCDLMRVMEVWPNATTPAQML